MKFLDPKQWSKKMDILGVSFPKGVFYFLGGIVALTILIWVTGFALRSGLGVHGLPGYSKTSDNLMMGGGTTGGYYGGNDGYAEESAARGAPPMAPGVPGADYDAMYGERGAVTSMPSPMPGPNYSVGDDAEEFEVKTYDASIKRGDSEAVCNDFAALKERADVIFSYANEYEDGCQFNFKTPKEQAPGILAMIEGYDPEHLRGQTESIKPRLDNYTSEEEILRQRLDSINATLESAEATYAELAELAAETRDAEALARVIGAKLQFIQQMTNERLAINSALTRLSRNKSEESDRLNYAFFTVRVYEQKIFDPERLIDEWTAAARQFVREANGLVIGLSLGLLIHALIGIQLALYLFLFLVIAKYGWRFVRDFWNR